MRNERGKEIIRPSGTEVMEYLNDGWGICNKCGALMDEEIRNNVRWTVRNYLQIHSPPTRSSVAKGRPVFRYAPQ